MPRWIRVASLLVVLTSATVGVSVVVVPWYRHVAYADPLTAWAWVPEVGVDFALAGTAAAVGAAGLILGARLPRILAVVGSLALLALAALVVYRLVQPPDIGVDVQREGEPSIEPGLILSAAAACVSLLAMLALTWARIWSTKTCPDCAESVPSQADTCPHCDYRFPVARGWKRCPACGGKVRAEARVCKHCGTRLDARGPSSSAPAARSADRV